MTTSTTHQDMDKDMDIDDSSTSSLSLDASLEAFPNTRPIVVSGPSRASKRVLVQKLIDSYPDKFFWVVSHTTRAPGLGEVEGTTYNFVSHSTFAQMIETGSFIEYTVVRGDYYGTSRDAVTALQREGSIALLEVNDQGSRAIGKAQGNNARFVYITPPTFHESEYHLGARRMRCRPIRQKLIYNPKSDQTCPVLGIRISNADLDQAQKELEEFVFFTLLDEPAPTWS
ncbi:unnamed protein product [Fusarium graminearum]|nr:hypothetical protein HG531_010768 [Fusarium graminearum]PCD36701.1 hypothetical protein FGRA07_07705 [Fusarium graminearum]CAF3589098.1 unnamed protein product [Fusarium graminearum]CAG1979987.1 unnamed protein product [Fusarium graminearum]CAG1996294.1 unnamed protein product [Fusarium graminearum]